MFIVFLVFKVREHVITVATEAIEQLTVQIVNPRSIVLITTSNQICRILLIIEHMGMTRPSLMPCITVDVLDLSVVVTTAVTGEELVHVRLIKASPKSVLNDALGKPSSGVPTSLDDNRQ